MMKNDIDALYRWIAWHLPKRLITWCYIRVTSHASMTTYELKSMSEITITEALSCWDDE